jgi:hypothetical protein
VHVVVHMAMVVALISAIFWEPCITKATIAATGSQVKARIGPRCNECNFRTLLFRQSPRPWEPFGSNAFPFNLRVGTSPVDLVSGD